MIFSGFASGFREQGETNRRRRMELAKAFETFKQNNPYATYDEYQAFIDNRVGGGLGSNYLRGGVPGEEVLRQLADDNAERRRLDERRQRMSDLSAQTNLMADLDGRIDAALLNMEGDDFDSAYTNFMAGFGEDSEELFSGMNLRNRFTADARNRLIGDRLISLSPQIRSYISATGGKITDDNLDQFANYLNVPVSQIQPFVDMANEEYQRSVDEWTIQNNTRVINVINNAIADGESPQDAVEALLRGTNIDIEDFDLESAEAEATRIREREEEDRERRLDTERRTAISRVETSFRQDPAIQAAMRRGDQEAVTQLMFTRAQRYLTDEEFELVYGVSKDRATPEVFAEVFESERQEALSGQLDSQSARRDQAAAASSEIVQNTITQNQERAVEYFSNLFGDSAGALAGDIASRYHMSPSMLRALTNAFSTIPEDLKEEGNISAIQQHVMSHPDVTNATAGGPDLQDYARSQGELAVNRLGGFNVESYDAWHTRSQDELTGAFRNMQEDLNTAQSIEDPQQRLAYLQQMQSQIRQFSANAQARINLRGERADNWVEYGTGGWDQARASELNGIVTQTQEALQGQLAELAAQTQQEIDQQPQINPASTQELSDEGSALVQDITEGVSRYSASQMIDAASYNNFSLGLQSLGEYAFQSEAENARRDGIRDIVNRDGVRERIIDLMTADPQLASEIPRDLRDMTAEQFMEKYGDRLREQAQN